MPLTRAKKFPVNMLIHVKHRALEPNLLFWALQRPVSKFLQIPACKFLPVDTCQDFLTGRSYYFVKPL